MQQQQASSRRGLGVLVGGWVVGWLGGGATTNGSSE